MTCDKCGFSKVVTKTPESTRAWFKKWHYKLCDGQPIYRPGVTLPLGILQRCPAEALMPTTELDVLLAQTDSDDTA